MTYTAWVYEDMAQSVVFVSRSCCFPFPTKWSTYTSLENAITLKVQVYFQTLSHHAYLQNLLHFYQALIKHDSFCRYLSTWYQYISLMKSANSAISISGISNSEGHIMLLVTVNGLNLREMGELTSCVPVNSYRTHNDSVSCTLTIKTSEHYDR